MIVRFGMIVKMDLIAMNVTNSASFHPKCFSSWCAIKSSIYAKSQRIIFHECFIMKLDIMLTRKRVEL